MTGCCYFVECVLFWLRSADTLSVAEHEVCADVAVMRPGRAHTVCSLTDQGVKIVRGHPTGDMHPEGRIEPLPASLALCSAVCGVVGCFFVDAGKCL
jgi:hypothetical protein